MNQPTIEIPQFSEVAAAAKTEIDTVEQSAGLVDKMVISDHAGMETAAQWIAVIKSSRKDIDDKRKSFTNPLNKVVKDLNAFFKPALTSLDAMEVALKEKVVNHITTSLAKRDALLETVRDQTDSESKSAIISASRAYVPPHVDGVSIREEWNGRIDDPDKVVAWAIENNRMEILKPNEMILDMITKSQRKDPKIPGWSAFLKRTVVVTAAKVKK